VAERRPLPEAPVADNQLIDELIDELEGALAAARDQLRLLRGSLATLIGFLERPSG
jgi:hypothetical protein